MSKRIGLIFAGQGAQYPGMGADIVQASEAANKIFEQADNSLNRSLSDLCFNGSQEELTDTANCQPAIYTMSLACLALLKEKTGTASKPVVCAGLSLGEFAALHAANAFSFTAGLHLLEQRGRFMAEACTRHNGGMAAVLNANPQLVQEVCARHDIDVANWNSPGQVVISGDSNQLQTAIEELKTQKVKRIIPLQVAGAFHSRLMAEAAAQFAGSIDQAEIASPDCPVVQNYTGQATIEPERIKHNLKAQITNSVDWEGCARVMMEKADSLIELGPGSALTGFIKKIDREYPVWPGGTVEQIETAARQVE